MGDLGVLPFIETSNIAGCVTRVVLHFRLKGFHVLPTLMPSEWIIIYIDSGKKKSSSTVIG